MISSTQEISPQERQGLAEQALLSEKYIPQVMPAVLRSGDLVTLLLLNTFWVTNITAIAAGGPAGFIYWIVCGCTFFIPCSIVMAQLAKMFPHEGSIFNWTYHALGIRWSFFIGICAWLPGILSIVNAAAAIISWFQALNSQWLTETWQQGIAILVVLLFTGFLACQRTRMVQHVMNIAAIAMGIGTVLIVVAAVVWLASGHHIATNFAAASGWAIQPSNFALLGSATLALLGSDMPLAMAGEIDPEKKRSALSSHLTWGTIFTLAGYLIFTFAILVVQGAGVAANTYNPMVLLISTVDQVFGGKIAGDVMAICLGFYFLMIPVAGHVCCARLLLVGSVDRRISIRYAKLNKNRVPINAIVTQVAITVGAALVIYFLIPSISFLGKPADLSNIAYNVIGASLLLVWAFSFLFPFIDVTILYFKKRNLFQQNHILPLPILAPLLAVCTIAGMLLCLATIVFTLQNSFIPSLIPNSTWWYVIGGSALGCILVFAVFSVLTSSEVNWEELNRSV
ncbi:MAG TPA: APC family permease [Ktedonobacteraceae bacterium]|nr:APC family permease [Ktedonobacteraceae bacterium]